MEFQHAQILGSVVAGVCSTVLGHPLDTIKTHLQTNPGYTSSGKVLSELRFGVFRGMAPPLVNAIVMNSVMFSVFEAVDSRVHNPFLAGILSGFATAIISTPTDCLKIRMQLAPSSTSAKAQSLRSSLASLLGDHGRSTISILYRGFGTNLAREGIFTMVYLGIYHWAMARGNSDSDSSIGIGIGIGMDVHDDPEQQEQQQQQHLRRLLFVAATSASTGALAWVASYPFDVAKTLLQSGASTATVRALWERGGPRAFFRGCLPSTGRAMLVTSSRMIAYDQVLRWCAAADADASASASQP